MNESVGGLVHGTRLVAEDGIRNGRGEGNVGLVIDRREARAYCQIVPDQVSGAEVDQRAAVDPVCGADGGLLAIDVEG